MDTISMKWIYTGGAAIVLVLIVLVFVHARDASLALAYAKDIVAQCSKTNDHGRCYEESVPTLYPKQSVDQLFSIIREIRRQDPTYQFCHVLAHKIGERVVAEYPSKWFDVIPLNPADGLCSNGYIHGVIGGRFRAEVLDDATLETLIPDFKRACEPRESWQPSSLDRAICYHGMGHLFTFITNANLRKALSLCERTTSTDFRRVCIEGVFMQIFQPLEPDDFELIKQMPVQPATSTVRTFCAAYTEPAYVGACLRESWPMFRKGIVNGSGIVSFCSDQPDQKETDKCFTSVTTLIGRMSLGKPEQAAAACSRIPAERQAECFEVIAKAILEEDRMQAQQAVALCRRAGDGAGECLSYLIRKAHSIFGGNMQQFGNFCKSLTEPELRQKCEMEKKSSVEYRE